MLTNNIQDTIEGMGIRRLRRTPHGYSGCCCINPNHHDNKPSMHINFDKGMVKCFSCGAFKPMFDFLIEAGIPFDECVDYLLVGFNAEGRELKELEEYILGTAIPKSMLDRGFEIPTLQHFEVGYDAYENHITIPLRFPLGGKLYGIQYRRFPKDLWTSDGFVKDNYIYNYQETEERTYVEGFTDTWMAYQNGTEEISACLTASPSIGQYELMSKHKVINLALDNDKAGWKGAFNIYEQLGRELEINIIKYKGKDAGACSYDAWQRAMERPVPFVEFEVAMIRYNKPMYDEIVHEVRRDKKSNEDA